MEPAAASSLVPPDLHQLSRKELQGLAKRLGLRANKRSEDILADIVARAGKDGTDKSKETEAKLASFTAEASSLTTLMDRANFSLVPKLGVGFGRSTADAPQPVPAALLPSQKVSQQDPDIAPSAVSIKARAETSLSKDLASISFQKSRLQEANQDLARRKEELIRKASKQPIASTVYNPSTRMQDIARAQADVSNRTRSMNDTKDQTSKTEVVGKQQKELVSASKFFVESKVMKHPHAARTATPSGNADQQLSSSNPSVSVTPVMYKEQRPSNAAPHTRSPSRPTTPVPVCGIPARGAEHASAHTPRQLAPPASPLLSPRFKLGTAQRVNKGRAAPVSDAQGTSFGKVGHITPLKKAPARVGAQPMDEKDREMERIIRKSMLSDHPGIKWSQVQGTKSPKEFLNQHVLKPFRMATVDKNNNLKDYPLGLLVFGPSGVGKTFIVEALLTGLSCKVIRVPVSEVLSRHLDRGQQLARGLFKVARHHSPCVIFVDDVDLLLPETHATSVEESIRKLRTEILVQMDELTLQRPQMPVMVVAASRHPERVDKQVLRYLRCRLQMGLPDPETREGMIFALMANQSAALTVEDVETLTRLTEGYSSREIEAICQQVIMRPLREMDSGKSKPGGPQRSITLEDFYQELHKNPCTVDPGDCRILARWVQQEIQRMSGQ